MNPIPLIPSRYVSVPSTGAPTLPVPDNYYLLGQIFSCPSGGGPVHGVSPPPSGRRVQTQQAYVEVPGVSVPPPGGTHCPEAGGSSHWEDPGILLVLEEVTSRRTSHQNPAYAQDLGRIPECSSVPQLRVQVEVLENLSGLPDVLVS